MMQMEYRPKKLWGVLMTEEHMPTVVTITKVIDETPTIKTFVFDELFNISTKFPWPFPLQTQSL